MSQIFLTSSLPTTLRSMLAKFTIPILKLEGQLDFIVNDFSGIGLVDCSVLPHWGRDDFKEIYKSAFDDIYNCTEKIVCLREEQFVYVEDNSIKIENVKFF